MAQIAFERWNWEYDYGVGRLPEGMHLPPAHAIAHYDHRGRLYRVTAQIKESTDRSDDDPASFGTYVYEYFCDSEGRIIQKRSLDEKGSVFLIVDVEYDVNGQITETAWWPDCGRLESRRRRVTEQREENATV